MEVDHLSLTTHHLPHLPTLPTLITKKILNNEGQSADIPSGKYKFDRKFLAWKQTNHSHLTKS